MIMTTTGAVTSDDGATIGYHQVGRGPGLVILHGAMQTGRSQLDLAQALSADFTCYLPDRRGRGSSGPAGTAYGLEREVADLSALIEATGARHVAGVSSGAIITLRTLPVRPDLHGAVVFEPPLLPDGAALDVHLSRLDQELTAGNVPAALVTGMKAAELGPPVFNLVPRKLLELLTRRMLKGPGATFAELAPTLRQDLQLAREAAGDLERYRAVRQEVLLLGGTRTRPYLRAALAGLEEVLPHATKVLMEGLDHSATSNTADRGRPGRAAEEIRRFLKDR
ncbi:alpha/beta hydrolase [Nonomuraea salmonea]